MRLPDATAVRRGSPISLTALIDVVFILLLFFMLSSTFIQWRSLDVVVDNPGESSEAEPKPPVVVQLRVDGTLAIGAKKIGRNATRGELAAALDGHLQRDIVLEPVGDATTQQVVWALDRLKAAGAVHLTLANATGRME